MNKSLMARPAHIGLVVKDLERTVEFFESMGVGPFEGPKGVGDVIVRERSYKGKPIRDLGLDVRIGRMGPVKLEIIQPSGVDSLWKDSLDTKGEGINHLAYSVEDLGEAIAYMEKRKFKAVYRSVFSNGGGAVYFDAREIGGLFYEFIQWGPPSK